MTRWPSIAAAASLALVAAGFASTAPAQNRNATPYPAETRKNFMEGCMSDGSLSEQLCGCIYRNLERQLTFAEFVDLDKAASENRDDHPLMPKVIEVAKACIADSNT